MVELNDTDRINAIADEGFSVWCNRELINATWVETWFCVVGFEDAQSGESLREAMDKAIIAYRNEQSKGVQSDLLQS